MTSSPPFAPWAVMLTAGNDETSWERISTPAPAQPGLADGVVTAPAAKRAKRLRRAASISSRRRGISAAWMSASSRV